MDTPDDVCNFGKNFIIHSIATLLLLFSSHCIVAGTTVTAAILNTHPQVAMFDGKRRWNDEGEWCSLIID